MASMMPDGDDDSNKADDGKEDTAGMCFKLVPVCSCTAHLFGCPNGLSRKPRK